MSTKIGAREWTYFEGGQYPCTCFFCERTIPTTGGRWYSGKPTTLYACNECFEYKNDDDLIARYPPQSKLVEEKSTNTAQNTTTYAVNTTNPQTDREGRIAEAHRENMEANERLVKAVNNLWAVGERLCNILEARQ